MVIWSFACMKTFSMTRYRCSSFIGSFKLIFSFIAGCASEALIFHSISCWIDIADVTVPIEVFSFTQIRRQFSCSASFCRQYFEPYPDLESSIVYWGVFLQKFGLESAQTMIFEPIKLPFTFWTLLCQMRHSIDRSNNRKYCLML